MLSNPYIRNSRAGPISLQSNNAVPVVYEEVIFGESLNRPDFFNWGNRAVVYGSNMKRHLIVLCHGYNGNAAGMGVV